MLEDILAYFINIFHQSGVFTTDTAGLIIVYIARGTRDWKLDHVSNIVACKKAKYSPCPAARFRSTFNPFATKLLIINGGIQRHVSSEAARNEKRMRTVLDLKSQVSL